MIEKQKMKPAYILATLGSIGLLIALIYRFTVVEYEEYIEGSFLMHLLVFGLAPIVVVLILLHIHGELTGWRNGWERRLFRGWLFRGNHYEMFTIPAGRHRSAFRWRPFFRREVKFYFTLTNSCKYNIGALDQLAINKIVGFSDGSMNHHKNSFRLGWRYNVDRDELVLINYIYNNGVRSVDIVGTVEPDKKYFVYINCQDRRYNVHIKTAEGDFTKYYERGKSMKRTYKHILWPYFGGVQEAPHNIQISLGW